MPNFTALYSFYCRPMESDDTWITTGFLIDTRFYGFLHYISVKHVYLGWVVQWGLGLVYMQQGMIGRGTCWPKPSLSRAFKMSVSDFMADSPQLISQQGHLQSQPVTNNVSVKFFS